MEVGEAIRASGARVAALPYGFGNEVGGEMVVLKILKKYFKNQKN